MNAEEHRQQAELHLLGVNAQLTEMNSAGDVKLEEVLSEPAVLLSLQLSLQIAQVHATLATNLPADAAAVSAAQGRIEQLSSHIQFVENEKSQLRAELATARAERDEARAQLAGRQP